MKKVIKLLFWCCLYCDIFYVLIVSQFESLWNTGVFIVAFCFIVLTVIWMIANAIHYEISVWLNDRRELKRQLREYHSKNKPATPETTRSLLEKRPHLILDIIAALMLLGALVPWPYGYYQILRFVVCGVSVYVAYLAYNWQKLWATWMFGFIALLFNPLIPIYLTKKTWQPIDIICAVLFAVVAFDLKNPSKENRKKDKDLAL
jgi:hypothetical protein